MENVKKEQVWDLSVDAGRRKALRKITVGLGVLAGYSLLPTQWTKPIIGQIVLPAHAATSGSVLHDPCTVTLLEGDESSDTVKVRVDGYVTPPAANLPVWIFANANADIGAVELETKTDAEGNYTLTFEISGGPGLTSVSVETRARGAEGVAHCAAHFSRGVYGNFAGELPLTSGFTKNPSHETSGEFIAEIGNAVMDLFVSDAQANGQPVTTACITLEGNSAQVYLTYNGILFSGAGTLGGVAIAIIGSPPVAPVSGQVEFLSVASDKVHVRIAFNDSSTFEGWLYPSADACNAPR